MIKIGIIGTHGIGKTTICHDLVAGLKKRGVNAEYLGEIAREAKKAGFVLNEGTTKDSQRWIIYTQIAKELGIGAEGDVDALVCDRVTFDNYIYFINSFGKDPLLDLIVDDHIKTYDLLFKVPINRSYLSDDKVRSIDPEFQKKIDELIEKELSERNIPFEVYTDVEDAINKIFNEMERG